MYSVSDIGHVPSLTTAQMREVDRVMIEDYGITLVQMMENAGRGLAHLARDRFLGGDARGKQVTVLAGTGGNGGGALTGARRLHNWGAKVSVFVTGPSAGRAAATARQLEIVRRLQIPVRPAEKLVRAEERDLVVDGVIGYSLRGAPRGNAAAMIAWANDQAAPILSLDIPSGVDGTTGAVRHPAIRAIATLTLALPKAGLRAPTAADHVGELYLADIGVPPALYARPSLGLEVGAVFAQGDLLRVR